MPQADLSNAIEQMKALVEPWHASLQNPAQAQEKVLEELIGIYNLTEYGRSHACSAVDSAADFRRAFPVCTYPDYRPLIERNHTAAKRRAGGLGNHPRAHPRGNEIHSHDPTDPHIRVSASRAVVNFALSSRRFDIFAGVNLNLNFPSKIGTIKVGERELDYGYSSGIYTSTFPRTPRCNPSPPRTTSMRWAEERACAPGKSVSTWLTNNAANAT